MSENGFEQSSARVKREPPVEFVLILPRPTYNLLAVKKEEDVKRKRIPTVRLTRLDEKWRKKAKRFQTCFICPHCQLVVKGKGHLAQHLRSCSKINPTHSSERNFHCHKCDVGFKSKSGLLKHLKKKSIYKCSVCDVKFACYLLLDRHRKEFHKNVYVFKCDKCPYKTRYKGNLTNHDGTHDKPIACETCQKKFSRNDSLKLHQMHHKHGIYATSPEETCDECGKSFSNPHYRKLHQKQVHDANETKCKECGKICKNRVSLNSHSRIHVKVECSICHKTISKNFVSLHMQGHSENIFQCDLCDHSAKIKNYLKEHIERKHLLRKLVNDSKCRKDFSDFELLQKLLLRHGSSATSNEKKFKCQQCSKAFVTLRILKQHKKKVHVDKLVECEICKKKIRQPQLKFHMKFHSPGNHFECELCDYKSEGKTFLERHIKARHPNGALICPFGCMEKFASFDQILEHRKIHIGKKQWKCMKCEYQTTGHQQLLKHMITKKHKIAS